MNVLKRIANILGPVELTAGETQELLGFVDAETTGARHPDLSTGLIQKLSEVVPAIAEHAELKRWHTVYENLQADPRGSAVLRSLDSQSKLFQLAALPAAVFGKLSSDAAYQLLAQKAIPSSKLEEFFYALKFPDKTEILEAIRENYNTPGAKRLMEGKPVKMTEAQRERLARSTDTPLELLGTLAKDSRTYIRGLVAHNLITPPETLAVLAKDSNEDVRCHVAYNRRTPVEVLVKLAGDTDVDVRWNVAQNPNTPLEVIVSLAKGRNPEVREAVAENPNTPVEVLVKLAKDRHESVRRCVAVNPNTPPETLAALAKDDDDDVREAATEVVARRKPLTGLSKAEMLQRGFSSKEAFDHGSVAFEKRVPGYTLDTRGTNWVRYIYASDPNNEFPPELFAKFNLHRILPGNGKPLGWIGGKWDAAKQRLYVTEMQSDLLQRTFELRNPRLKQFAQYKSKLENRFDGWIYTFFNQAVREAKEKGAKEIAMPTASFYAKSVPGAKNIASIYEKALRAYPHRTEGNWNIIELNDSVRVARRRQPKRT